MCGPFLDFILPHRLSVYPLCCQCASLLFTALWVKRTGGRAPDSVPRDGHGCSQWGARLAGPHAVCHEGNIKEEWDLHTSEFLKVGFGHSAGCMARPSQVGSSHRSPCMLGEQLWGQCVMWSPRGDRPLSRLCAPPLGSRRLSWPLSLQCSSLPLGL